MGSRKRVRRAAASGIGLGVACAAFAVSSAIGGSGTAMPTHDSPPPVRVTTQLPEWRAPGVEIVVRGWTGRRLPVTLVGRGQALVRARSSYDGRFEVRARLWRVGAWPLELRVAGRRHAIGSLEVRPVTLAAGGDVTFGDRVATTVASRGAPYVWSSVGPLLAAADVATVNLEGVVSTRGTPVPDKAFHFRGPPAALDAAARVAGIDVTSLANNHSGDFGHSALLDTIRHARKAGISTVGAGASLAASRRPAYVERGGLRIAFLGYSDVRPPGFDAGPATPGAAPANVDQMADDVRRARRNADVVVVWFHWGIELMRQPTSRQRQLAGAVLAAGASVVLGAHPHVLQPLEQPGRRRLVAWSLGNFVFPPHSPGTETTGLLLVSLDRHGVVSRQWHRAQIEGVRPVLVGGR